MTGVTRYSLYQLKPLEPIQYEAKLIILGEDNSGFSQDGED